MHKAVPRVGEAALERMHNSRNSPGLKRALRRLLAFEPSAGHTGECIECDNLNVALIPLRTGCAGVYARSNANFDQHAVEPLGMCGEYVKFEFIYGRVCRLYADAGVRRLGGYCARDYGLIGAAQLAAELHPDDVEGFERLFEQLCEGVDAASLSYRMRLKDGGDYRRVYFSAIRRVGASERRYTGVYIDVARVAGTECSLMQSESTPVMRPMELGAAAAGISEAVLYVHATRGEGHAAGSEGQYARARAYTMHRDGGVQ